MSISDKIRGILEEDWSDGYVIGREADQDIEEPYEVSSEDGYCEFSDNLDVYLFTLASVLMEDFDLDEDTAADFISDVAGVFYSKGKLPPLPLEPDSSEDVLWLTQAVMLGFHKAVFELAKERFA